MLRSLCPGWQVGILCSGEFLAGHTHLHFQQTLPLVNSGLLVTFFIGQTD